MVFLAQADYLILSAGICKCLTQRNVLAPVGFGTLRACGHFVLALYKLQRKA